jgi:hypothetical protein
MVFLLFYVALLSNETNRQCLTHFLDTSTSTRFLIVENADALNVANEFPLEIKTKLVCFVKRHATAIDRRLSMKKQLVIAEFTRTSLTQLALFINQVVFVCFLLDYQRA